MFADLDYDIEEDKLGIPTVPGKVTLQKDAQNLIGISIGGGAQYCPCLYIVQVFDNTPAALDGTVAAGDEITGVNGRSIKGKTKVEVAKMIQEVKGEVTIHYNKLQADPKQGMSLDIGKLGQSSGVWWPHKPQTFVVSSHGFSDQASPQGQGAPRGAVPAAVPGNQSLVSHCPMLHPHQSPASHSGTLLPEDCPL